MNSSVDLSLITHNYSYIFPFEKNYKETIFWEYLQERWTDSFLYAAVYVLVVFSLQHYMKTRRGFDLRRELALWSSLLAMFSTFGAIRTLPEFKTSIFKYGFQYSMCVPTYVNGVTGVWICLFTVSKVLEFGDTIFIVLRKRPLAFLHWYHHVTVLIYSWYSYAGHTAAGRWFMVMNYVVHSVMYTYYALRAMQIYVPKQISLLITSMQLLQMVMGCFLNINIYYIKNRGEYCSQTYTNLAFGITMYFSYFVLFAQFFYKSYIAPKSKSVRVKAN